MRLGDNVETLIRDLRVLDISTSGEMDQRILSDALGVQEEFKKMRLARTEPNIWGMIMKSQVTRYSAAAVIVIAILVVLLNPFGISKRDGIALADVIRNTEKIETVVKRGHRVFTSLDDPNESVELDITKYYSTQHGYAEKGYLNDKLEYHWSVNTHEKLAVVIIPPWKKYFKSPLTDDQVKILELTSLKGIVDFFLEGDYEKLGRSTINGIEVEGFEFRDIKLLESFPKILMNIQDIRGRVWIGVQDLLPVKVEADAVLGRCLFTGFEEERLHDVGFFEDYDVELDEGIFCLDIPADYTPLDIDSLLLKK